MAVPQYLGEDFKQALLRLLPRGRAWSREADAVQSLVAEGLTKVYERNAGRARDVLAETFPPSTYELLPEWEASLGLPDPCQGLAPSVEARRNQVVARFIGSGGQSKAFFIAFAATLGYTITITEFKPFTFGMPFGLPLFGDDWAHAWQINAPEFTEEFFLFGTSGMGEFFATWSNDVLQCELRRLAPAHTVLLFNYS